MEPLLAARIVCRVHIEQTPTHILHHGLLNADRTVGVVILLAIANPATDTFGIVADANAANFRLLRSLTVQSWHAHGTKSNDCNALRSL